MVATYLSDDEEMEHTMAKYSEKEYSKARGLIIGHLIGSGKIDLSYYINNLGIDLLLAQDIIDELAGKGLIEVKCKRTALIPILLHRAFKPAEYEEY